MTRLLLVRWPDDVDLPVGVIGRFETVAPARYAFIEDERVFTAWARTRGRVAECGHPTQAYVRLIRDRALERWEQAGERPPPGIAIRSESEVRIRVWPAVTHAGERVDRFLWESPVEVVRAPIVDRRSRSARRGRWRR